MADDVTLPLDRLGEIPGVGNVESVDIPTGDIIDLLNGIQDTVFSLDDLLEFLEGDAQEALADATPIDEIAEAIGALFDGPEGPSTGPTIEEITEEIVAQTNILLPEIQDNELDPDLLADEIADEIDQGIEGDTVINFETVFGALASDIQNGFELALQELIGAPGEFPGPSDSVAGGQQAIAQAILEFDEFPELPEPPEIGDIVLDKILELPGADLLEGPDEFVDEQVDRVTDGLVDQSAVNNLQESIEGID